VRGASFIFALSAGSRRLEILRPYEKKRILPLIRAGAEACSAPRRLDASDVSRYFASVQAEAQQKRAFST
jgi:hypothetical protein